MIGELIAGAVGVAVGASMCSKGSTDVRVYGPGQDHRPECREAGCGNKVHDGYVICHAHLHELEMRGNRECEEAHRRDELSVARKIRDGGVSERDLAIMSGHHSHEAKLVDAFVSAGYAEIGELSRRVMWVSGNPYEKLLEEEDAKCMAAKREQRMTRARETGGRSAGLVQKSGGRQWQS